MSKKEVPWFNSYIQKCIDEAYSRWKHFKTNAFRDDFKSLRNKVNFAIRKAKESFYENKFKQIVNSKKTWDAIREMGVCNKNRDNNLSAINVNDLNENFVNINMPVIQFDYYKNYRSPFSFNDVFSFLCVNELDVIKYFIKIKSNAIAFDEMYLIFLKALLPKLLLYIVYIFNTILKTSSYPIQWKQAKVIPIPKACNEYRPIAILPFISKVF